MRLFQSEVFGPTVNLVTVASFDQALACANGIPARRGGGPPHREPGVRERFLREKQRRGVPR